MENKTCTVATGKEQNSSKTDKKLQNVSEVIECQYQTVTVRKIREEVTTTTSNINKVEDLLKKIVPAKSFLYRHQSQLKQLQRNDKTPTSYVPMDVGKKPRRFFRLSYEYPLFDLSKFRFSKQENNNFNDRGYYSIKTTTTNKNSTKVYKNVESRTKYKSFSNSDDFNEIVLEDHFYEDLCYNDIDERKRSRSTSQINSIKTTAKVKIQGIFHSLKLPSFFKKDEKVGDKETEKEVELYENENVESGSMYDSVIVQTDKIDHKDLVQPSKIVVEEYMEPIQPQKDYCDVTFEGRDDSFLGYILSIFENTFRMRRESNDQNISENSEADKNPRATDNGTSPIQKRKEGRKSGKTNMADRPLPVPIDNEPYYMKIDRTKAELYLIGQPDGTFILRPSSQPNHAYTLSVVCSNAVHNIGVRKRPDGKLALGFTRRGERHFATVASLLRFHRRRRLLLVGGNGVIGATTLKEPPVYYSTPSSLPVRVLAQSAQSSIVTQ